MASLSTSFNNQGATPLYKNNDAVLKAGQFNTPKSKALLSFATPSPSTSLLKPSSMNMANSTSSGYTAPTVQNNAVKTQTGSNPQQNVKSTKVTETTYHPTGENGMAPTPPINSGMISNPTPVTQTNPVQTNPTPVTSSTPEAPKSTFAGLIDRAKSYQEDAARTNLIIERAKQDALHDPNFSLDTGIGRAGQIASNYGLMGQQANALATGASELAGKVAPEQVSYSNQYIDPTTGQPVNPQAGQDMQNAVALQVQKLKSGATDPASARTALSNYGQAGLNALEQALGTSFNPNVATANQSSASELTALKNNLQSTFNGVDANFNLLLNTAAQGGINQTNVPILNTLQQNVSRGLTSNEAVINFRNTLAAVRAGYANILGGGTTTVDSQNRAQEAIPDNISIDGLRSLGKQLESEAKNRIAGIEQQVKTITSPQGGSTGGAISWADL